MMFTRPMKLLNAAVLKDNSQAVSRELLNLGVMDSVSIKEMPGKIPEGLKTAEDPSGSMRLVELRKRIEAFFSMQNPPIPLPDESFFENYARQEAGKAEGEDAKTESINLDAVEKRLGELDLSMNRAREGQKNLQEELLKLSEMRKQFEALGDLNMELGSTGSRSFLEMISGTIPEKETEGLERSLSGIPLVLMRGNINEDGRIGLMLMFLKRDQKRINEALEYRSWEPLKEEEKKDRGNRTALLSGLLEKEKSIAVERDRKAVELRSVIAGRKDELFGLWSALRMEELKQRISSNFSLTDRVVFFSGWIPQNEMARVEEAIRNVTESKCYLEWLDPSSQEARGMAAPVEMKNPEVLKTFQNLVSNFSTPSYGTIDPTPFVAISYLSMFGLMFADAGQGLVLLIIGLAGSLRQKKKHIAPGGIFNLILYCGIAAIISGALFGSYFGFPLFPPIWFNYHGAVTGEHLWGPIQDIFGILGLTIKFGMAVLGLGIILNCVNAIRQKAWMELVFGKAGVLGAWIYFGGAWIAFYFVGSDYKNLPDGRIVALLVLLPVLLLFLKSPLEFYHEKKKESKKFGVMSLVNFLLEWMVEILEVFSGYLANTLSFMRVAGLGIAHVSLMAAFEQIARMTGSGVGMISVLLVGNALVIALEGLTAGIQSLRLNYYEFFSKFFSSGGKAYKPVSLGMRD